ncbi:MAG: NUDIX domain-containing protein [Promicromonosporaceae bacterium]|nr:NUDIX domain-containing protein [Promicromonosporaceae bacterium]
MAATRGKAIPAAGAIPYRENEGQLEVALVHRPRYQDWSLPKGKLLDGETLQAGATREVNEEIKEPVILGIPLATLRYPLPSTGDWKEIAYWAARLATDRDHAPLAARLPIHLADPTEIDKVVWLPALQAANKLTRDLDRRPLMNLLEAYEAGRLKTHTVVIARHGKALPRSLWNDPDDAERPLTSYGQAHAAALVSVLSAYGVRRVVSSRWERCAATVRPYIDATGLKPWLSDNLTERDHEKSPGRVAATVLQLLTGKKSAVMCTHRPVLPTVLDVLGQHAKREVADQLPRSDPFLKPGEALAAHVARTEKGPRVMAVELITPVVF